MKGTIPWLQKQVEKAEANQYNKRHMGLHYPVQCWVFRAWYGLVIDRKSISSTTILNTKDTDRAFTWLCMCWASLAVTYVGVSKSNMGLPFSFSYFSLYFTWKSPHKTIVTSWISSYHEYQMLSGYTMQRSPFISIRSNWSIVEHIWVV